MKLIRLFFLIVIGLFLSNCQNNSNTKKLVAERPDKVGTQIQQKSAEQSAQKIHPGKAVYYENCLSCHQADGSGVPGMHPPLGPGSWVGKSPKELIAIMMKGLSGKIEVNGEIYNDFMPSHAQMSDEDLANVLSYVRSSFGNNFESVSPEMVKNIRSGK